MTTKLSPIHGARAWLLSASTASRDTPHNTTVTTQRRGNANRTEQQLQKIQFNKQCRTAIPTAWNMKYQPSACQKRCQRSTRIGVAYQITLREKRNKRAHYWQPTSQKSWGETYPAPSSVPLGRIALSFVFEEKYQICWNSCKIRVFHQYVLEVTLHNRPLPSNDDLFKLPRGIAIGHRRRIAAYPHRYLFTDDMRLPLPTHSHSFLSPPFGPKTYPQEILKLQVNTNLKQKKAQNMKQSKTK